MTCEQPKKQSNVESKEAPPQQTSAVSGPGELLQAKEVAAWLNCHVSVVYDLWDMKLIKGLYLKPQPKKSKRGKKGLRILASSVRDYIQAGVQEHSNGDRANEPPPHVEEAVLPSPKPERTMGPRQPGQKFQPAKSKVTLPYPGRSR
jgi:hypothetical protein